MDLLEEKAAMLSRLGSFWSKSQAEQGVNTARRLTHVQALGRMFNQAGAAMDMALGGGYVDDYFRVVRFSDKDVLYYGTQQALQERGTVRFSDSDVTHSRYRLLDREGFLGTVKSYDMKRAGVTVTEMDRPVIMPGPAADGGLQNYPDEYVLIFGLLVPEDMEVHSILMDDGRLLVQGVDFKAGFGWLQFPTNPVQLFSGMKFMARHVTMRRRNLLSFTLQLDDVYGDVSRVVEYYRGAQSWKSFYLAAAQAAGMAVARGSCRILSSQPFRDGYTYFTAQGRYDAPYKHNRVPAGTEVPDGYVFGGADLFVIISEKDFKAGVLNIPSISMDSIIPFKGLSAPDEVRQVYVDDVWQPDLDGPPETVEAYKAWARKVIGKEIKNPNSIMRENVLQELVRVLATKYMIVRINEEVMPEAMQMRLNTFLNREKPVGSVLLFSPLQGTIPA